MRGRVLQIFGDGKTLWRSYMNAHVQDLRLNSPVLDLGSGAYGTASYHHLIPGFKELDVTSVDMSPDRRPTWTADIEKGIPSAGETFNTCLVFNLLNYLYDYDFVLREILRVLRAGGSVMIALPYLFRLTNNPDDVFRFSGTALERILLQAGFEEVRVTVFGSGAAGAAMNQVDFLIPRVLRKPCLRAAWWADSIITRRSGGKYRNKFDYPLGFFAVARKRRSETAHS